MEGVSTFLESSTIHGLTYLSTTRKHARLFWILVVLAGFIGAGVLINESFGSWSESPVKTTVETLPISGIKLPKVTICPPKNTFTDLNYDLIFTENKTLTDEMRHEMFKYVVEVLEEDSFSQNNWTKLQEEDRFYNWYHGYTEIKSPLWYHDHWTNDDYFRYNLDTSSTSGVVTTQYFGKRFQPDLVERNLGYWVTIYVPKNVWNNENVTLHFNVENVLMKAISKDSKDEIGIEGDNVVNTKVHKNFTRPFMSHFISLKRDVVWKEVEQLKMDVMPGFRFSWWYTSNGVEVTSYPKYENYEITKQFRR